MLTHRMSLLTLFIFLGFSTKAQALWWSHARFEGNNKGNQISTITNKEDSFTYKISLYEKRDFHTIIHEHHTYKEKGFPYPYLWLFFRQNEDQQACWFTGKGSWKIIIGFKESENCSHKIYELNQQKNSNTSDSLELEPLCTSQEIDASQTICIHESKVPNISFILLATSEFWHLCSDKNIATKDHTAEERIANYLHLYKKRANSQDLPSCANALLNEILTKATNSLYFTSILNYKLLELIIVFPHDKHPNLKNN